VKQQMNVVALVKDTERYVFLYDDVSSSQMLQTLGQYAADKELSFTWYDAAVMSQKVRKLRREAEQEEQSRRLPKKPEIATAVFSETSSYHQRR